jgi:hypothetical protein
MNSTSSPYSPAYYEEFASTAGASAGKIYDIIRAQHVFNSVIDVGCGQGYWLREFTNKGTSDIMGLDGPWVKSSELVIPESYFNVTDLTKPVNVKKRYDLALCLEVAEHLPASAARTVVESLTRLSDVILFSAAIPYQPGDMHQNCQWPEYWAGLFREFHYAACDCIRDVCWNDPDITCYYKNNAILYVKDGAIEKMANPEYIKSRICKLPPRLVHPELYLCVAGTMSSYIDAQQTLSWSWRTFKRNVTRKLLGKKVSYELIPDYADLVKRAR